MSGLHWCLKHKKLLCIDCIGILIAIVLSVYMQHLVSLADSQHQAERWQSDGEIRYHQVSAFIQQDCQLDGGQIVEVRSQIQDKLIQASYSQDTVPGRLWVDSYMAKTTDSVSKLSELGASGMDSVNILGVGGDFFSFHPLHMLAGSTFSDKDIMQDKVVLDQDSAWTLFGGTDIAGKTVEIAGRSFVVSGVYKASEEKSEKRAKGKGSYIFMDYDTFREIYPDKGIICYEAALPNPVSGFAILAVKEAFGEASENLYADDVMLSFSDKEFLDNTIRFEPAHLLKKLFYTPNLLMRTTQISYPYWENSMRALEWKLEILLLIEIICLIGPVITVGILAVLLWRQLKQTVKENAAAWLERAGDFYYQKCQKWHQRKEKIGAEDTKHEI